MTQFKTLDQAQVSGKVVLVRLDLNVPIKNGAVADNMRIVRSLPTVRELSKKGAIVVCMSHLGRPDGEKKPEFSLAPVAKAFSEALGQAVTFVADCIGDVAASAIKAAKAGDVLLLENVRYYAAEEKNDPAFSKQLASLGDIYVGDAFGTAHRAHSSTAGIASFLPSYMGRLMQEELEALNKALVAPTRPVMAIVAGSKVSSKLALLQNLLSKVNVLVIGGAMAHTFQLALGYNMGKSLTEPNMVETAKNIMAEAKAKNVQLIIPTDLVVTKDAKAGAAATSIVAPSAIPADQEALDVGPETRAAIIAALQNMKTVIWNGPVGMYEVQPFEQGSVAIAQAIAALSKAGKLMSVVGGGDVNAAVALAKVEKDISFMSTAGGAFLEWLEGKTLPGVAALNHSPSSKVA